MDYEKKYKEALEIARKINSGKGVAAPSGWSVCETIFPELKESEDERIRKMIIYQMERWHEAAIENNVVKDIKDSADAITWLEKQGEEKPIYCHHEVDLSNCSEEYCKAYYDGWNNCNQQHEQVKAEQKPAWSEDDEKAINDIMWIIEAYRKNSFNETHTQMADDSENWLKALEERLK